MDGAAKSTVEDQAGEAEEEQAVPEEEVKEETTQQGTQIRRDLRETAFFFPEIKTNEQGEVIISFKAPESLTRWNFMGFAHTKDLKFGMIEKELITQKDLMVIPNPPRFFREGDRMLFQAKLANVSNENLSIPGAYIIFNII